MKWWRRSKSREQKVQDKPYIVPTVYGFAYFFLIIDVFAIGYYRDSAPFHTVGLTLIVFGMVAMIQTNSNLQALSLRLRMRAPGEAYQDIEAELSFVNQGGSPCYGLEAQADKPFELKPAAQLTELDREAKLKIHFPIESRGIYPIRRIKVSTRGLFGLFYTWRWFSVSDELVVYPEPKGHLPLPGGDEGALLSSQQQEDFIGHRDYQPGHSLKHIDWRAYARSDKLLLKEFADQAEEGRDLSWDDAEGETETRLSQLTAWVLQLHAEGRSFSLSLPGQSLSRSLGEEHTRRALRALAAHQGAA